MRSAQFLDNLNHAVRENPVAAGLIGVGLAWMTFGGSRTVIRETQGAAQAAKGTVDIASDAANAAFEPVASVADQVRRTATDMGDAVSDGMKAAASKVSDAVSVASAASIHGPDLYSNHRHASLRRDLVDFLERQPFALAAVGVAVGAAIATAFPRSAAEDRLVGSTGEMLRERAGNAVNAISDRAAAAIDAATDEAVAQDLTPEAATEAARAGATKLKNMARAAVDTAQGK
jgi:hypothetical protein